MNNSNSSYNEDKKCRICGYADIKNVNMFTGAGKNLLEKVLFVFPIVIYKNDPLPKNICKKCILNVTNIYNEIQRTVRIQSRWITNVRAIQPNHNYVRVLDMLETSHEVTRDSIRSTLGEEVLATNIRRLFNVSSKDASASPTSRPVGATSFKSSFTSDSDALIEEEIVNAQKQLETKHADSLSKHTPAPKSIKQTMGMSKDVSSTVSPKPCPSKIKEIQSKLELNGCTLVSVGTSKYKHVVNQQSSSSQPKSELPSTPPPIKSSPTPPLPSVPTISPQIKEEPPDDFVIEIKEEITEDGSTLDMEYDVNDFKCSYCSLEFKSRQILAAHQLVHMRLCLVNIFQKKYLHKRSRRGRLICIQNRKCIRCLNCWRVFVDNKSILEHWAEGECDFYCHICGKEFSSSPKLLREHVSTDHDISYRSSKFPRSRLSAKLIMKVLQSPVAERLNDLKILATATEQEPSPLECSSSIKKPEVTEITLPSSFNEKLVKVPTKPAVVASTPNANASEITQFACYICNKPFLNVKARNSHMRAHKPAYAYGDFVLPPKSGVDAYVNLDAYSFDDNGPRAPTAPAIVDERPSSSDAITRTTKPSNHNVHINATTNVPRGVRKKFVESRPNTIRNRNELLATSQAANNYDRSSNDQRIKVKSLVDLQQNSSQNSSSTKWSIGQTIPATTQNRWIPPVAIESESINLRYTNSELTNRTSGMVGPPSTTTTTQSLPKQILPTHDNMNYDKLFNCYPCGGKFPSKVELFRHKRKCQPNNQFTCEFCPKSFITCVDLQLHIMHMHKTPT